jgi:hypothetical protein
LENSDDEIRFHRTQNNRGSTDERKSHFTALQ